MYFFQTRRHLRGHLETHFGVNKFCEICKAGPFTKMNLKHHRMVRVQLLKFSHICPTFQNRSLLRSHLKSHFGANEFCEICKAGPFNNQNLKRHRMVREQSYPGQEKKFERHSPKKITLPLSRKKQLRPLPALGKEMLITSLIGLFKGKFRPLPWGKKF